MRARTTRGRAALLLVSVLGAGFVLAAEEQEQREEERQHNEAPEPPRGQLEFRVRSHPRDTFKPSEAISEDFPVAFPVDI